MVERVEHNFKNKNVLVTGGLGFIGSNLVLSLVAGGAKVTVLDAMIQDYGGNEFNLDPVKNDVTINYCDIRDENAVNYLVRDKEYVFHLAGQVCHLMSLDNPFPDISINITGTAILMEALRKRNPDAVVVYTGTRGQYGSSVSLPVNEEAPTNPKGIYEISNLTAEKIIKVYYDVHQIRSVLLRLTNVYGPRSQMKHSRFGVANWFIRKAMDDNDPIKVFGDGSILRDFCYVDDCVEALLRSATTEAAFGQIFNVGSDIPVSFLELVEKIVEVAKRGSWEFADFSPERKAQEPGDFYSDITKISSIVGWRPKTSLEDGIARTIEFYEKNQKYYWEHAPRESSCTTGDTAPLTSAGR